MVDWDVGLLCLCFLLGEFAVCVFCLVGLLVAAMVEGFFFLFSCYGLWWRLRKRETEERETGRERKNKK